jgi:hypothetical protein
MDTFSDLSKSLLNDPEATKLHAIYSPLPTPKSIRLLEILPCDTSEIVKIPLEDVELEESSAYKALSYCWGLLDLVRLVVIFGTRLGSILKEDRINRSTRHLISSNRRIVPANFKKTKAVEFVKNI